jgi:glycosyltransferase involved in cell wall biosynthesis
MDSNYFDKIKSISNDPNILIHEGFISDDDLQYYFNSSDIAVLPFNRIENSGSAILAMGFKKPIISPRTGVIKNRLSLQDMLLYEDGGLKKSLQKADLMDSEQLQRLGEKNYTALREHAWEDFSSCFYANKSLQNIRIS